MQKEGFSLVLARTSTLFIFLLLLPINTYASQTILTIQIGSFDDLPSAERQFDLIKQGLQDKDLEYLRIEKIGASYSVRLGKFNDRS